MLSKAKWQGRDTPVHDHYVHSKIVFFLQAWLKLVKKKVLDWYTSRLVQWYIYIYTVDFQYLKLSRGSKTVPDIESSRYQVVAWLALFVCQGTKTFVPDTKKFEMPSIQDIESQLYIILITSVFLHECNKPASSAELQNFLLNSCGYWNFPKKGDVKITILKYVFWTMHTRGNNQGYKFAEDGYTKNLSKRTNRLLFITR